MTADAEAVRAAWERLRGRLRHHPACFHDGLAIWNRDEETCDCGLMADLALVQAAADAGAREHAALLNLIAACQSMDEGWLRSALADARAALLVPEGRRDGK